MCFLIFNHKFLMSEKFMFTILCCLAIFSKLKDEEETNFDVTDNIVTKTEKVYFSTYFQNCSHGVIFPV